MKRQPAKNSLSFRCLDRLESPRVYVGEDVNDACPKNIVENIDGRNMEEILIALRAKEEQRAKGQKSKVLEECWKHHTHNPKTEIVAAVAGERVEAVGSATVPRNAEPRTAP